VPDPEETEESPEESWCLKEPPGSDTFLTPRFSTAYLTLGSIYSRLGEKSLISNPNVSDLKAFAYMCI